MAFVLVISYNDIDVEIKIGSSSSDACHQSVQDRVSFRLLSCDIAGDKFVLIACMEDDPSGRAV
jgi:hypothetical protein